MLSRRFCEDCCMVLSMLGFIFILYLTILIMADPGRLHIVKHINAEEDKENYSTASVSGVIATLIYLAIGALLYYKNYGSQEKTAELFQNIREFFSVKEKNPNYEQQTHMFEQESEMGELKGSKNE